MKATTQCEPYKLFLCDREAEQVLKLRSQFHKVQEALMLFVAHFPAPPE